MYKIKEETESNDCGQMESVYIKVEEDENILSEDDVKSETEVSSDHQEVHLHPEVIIKEEEDFDLDNISTIHGGPQGLEGSQTSDKDQEEVECHEISAPSETFFCDGNEGCRSEDYFHEYCINHQSAAKDHNLDERNVLTNTELAPYSCTVCNRRFQKKNHVNMHLRIHKGDGLCPCKACLRSFLQKRNLLTHTDTQEKGPRFSCDNCGKSFFLKKRLSQHMRCHTGDRPFQCNACDKRFGWKHHLIRHLLIHTGDLPFACEECGKCFSQKSHLSRHFSVHVKANRPVTEGT